jgi:phosphatidylserine decarboxylase
MGRFNMGSTVIVLLPPIAVSVLEELGPADAVQVGQRLGRLR